MTLAENSSFLGLSRRSGPFSPPMESTGFAWISLAWAGNVLQVVNWGNGRTQLIYFLSLKDHCFLWLEKCLENCCFVYFACSSLIFDCVRQQCIFDPYCPICLRVGINLTALKNNHCLHSLFIKLFGPFPVDISMYSSICLSS